MRNKVRRFALLGLLVAAGFALAPAAFARSHWNVGVNIGFPGVSLGYSDCGRCGYGWGGGYGYGGYASVYAPAYYGPAYYGPAYAPAPAYYGYGYGYPAYGATYYYDRPVRRAYYSDRHYDSGRYHGRDRGRDRDYGHRAQYYDRGGHRR